jgi:hypothetical protein
LARNSLPIADRLNKPVSCPMPLRHDGYIPPCIPTRAYQVPSGANGQSLAYIYSRDSEDQARQAKVLTRDEARRIAVNIARLPELLHRESVD